jgi:hypothetical protein
MTRRCMAGLLILAAVLGGCGGGGPADENARYTTTVEMDTGDPPDLDDEGQIKEALSDLQGDFSLERSTGVCLELSRAGRDEILRETGQSRCDYGVFRLIQHNKRAAIKPRISTVFDVAVEGQRAEVTVGEPGRPDRTMPFVKEGQGWKVVSLRDAEPVAATLKPGAAANAPPPGR